MKERYEQLLYMFMQFWLKKNYTQSEKKNYYRIYLSKHLTTNIPYCTLRCLIQTRIAFKKLVCI